jgi:FxsC-like protein
MFVDGWTAGLPEYQSALKAFDQQNYVNCSVIVPWNDADPENQSNNQRLQEALKDALKFRFSGQNDLYCRSAINSEDDLRRQLVEVLTRLRAEVINKSTPDRGVIPESSGSRPIISGPGK